MLTLLLKANIVYAKQLSWAFKFFLFVANSIDSETLMPWILLTSEFKSTTESSWGSTWFTNFNGLCNYLYLFRKQTASSFFLKNVSLIRETLAITPTTWLSHQMPRKGDFMRIFVAVKGSPVLFKTESVLKKTSTNISFGFIFADR